MCSAAQMVSETKVPIYSGLKLLFFDLKIEKNFFTKATSIVMFLLLGSHQCKLRFQTTMPMHLPPSKVRFLAFHF